MSTSLLNVLPFNPNFGDAIAVQDLRGIHVLYISVQNFVRCSLLPNQNPGAVTVHYSLCMKRKGVHCTFLGFEQCTTLLALSFR